MQHCWYNAWQNPSINQRRQNFRHILSINSYMRNRYTINKQAGLHFLKWIITYAGSIAAAVIVCAPELGLIDIVKKFEWDGCINNDCCMDATQYLWRTPRRRSISFMWLLYGSGGGLAQWFCAGISGQKTISVCKQPPRSSACQPGHPFVGRQAQLEYQQKPGHKEAHHALH